MAAAAGIRPTDYCGQTSTSVRPSEGGREGRGSSESDGDDDDDRVSWDGRDGEWGVNHTPLLVKETRAERVS